MLIIVLPIALMQVAVTYVFFDAHWQTVTARLSDSLAGDIAWAVDSYREDPRPEAIQRIAAQAEKSMQLSIVVQSGRSLPTRRRASLFVAFDRTLRQALQDRLDAPFWFDTTRYPAVVDIRVQVPGGVMRIIAPRGISMPSKIMSRVARRINRSLWLRRSVSSTNPCACGLCASNASLVTGACVAARSRAMGASASGCAPACRRIHRKKDAISCRPISTM